MLAAMVDSVEDGATAGVDERELVDRLRQGDDAAFVALVERYHNSLVRLASSFLDDRAAAEDVAQETWLAVLRGVNRFAGRSSLKTWIFRILMNRARTRASREARSVPCSSLGDPSDGSPEPAVDLGRFFPPDHPQWPGGWAAPPASWSDIPEERFLAEETQVRVRAAIDALPASQRLVITLRDVEGLDAEDVQRVLGIGEVNQRVMLHRARSKVRRALESYLSTE